MNSIISQDMGVGVVEEVSVILGYGGRILEEVPDFFSTIWGRMFEEVLFFFRPYGGRIFEEVMALFSTIWG